MKNLYEIEDILKSGVYRIREIEEMCKTFSLDDFAKNKAQLDKDTRAVVEEITKNK